MQVVLKDDGRIVFSDDDHLNRNSLNRKRLIVTPETALATRESLWVQFGNSENFEDINADILDPIRLSEEADGYKTLFPAEVLKSPGVWYMTLAVRIYATDSDEFTEQLTSDKVSFSVNDSYPLDDDEYISNGSLENVWQDMQDAVEEAAGSAADAAQSAEDAQKAQEAAEEAAADAAKSAQAAEDAAEDIGKFAGKSILFVAELPDAGDPDYLYALVSEDDPSIFELYGWDDGQWKPLGNADVVANVTRTYAGTLLAAGWAENKQTLFVPDLSATDSVQVSPADANAEAYIEDGILATAVIDGGIVFTCASVPAADIQVNVCFTTQQVIPNTEGFYTKSEIAALAGGSTELTIDSNTFVITFTLKAIDGTVLSVNSVDLPLESVVVGGEYDEAAKAIVLTLQNGNTVSIPVGDLVDGLASQTALNAEIAARQSADSELGQRIDVIAERQPTSANITLAAVAWAANRQDVLVEGVTATNNIVVYPQDKSAANYVLADINVTQADGKLVFTCATTPTADIAVVVDIAA